MRTAEPTDHASSPARPGPARSSSRSWLAIGGRFVALLGALLLLGVIADEIREQEAIALDMVATPFLHGLATPALDAVMAAITTLGWFVVAPLFVLGVAWLAWRRHGDEARFLAVAVVGSVALNETMKLLFHRPRPQLEWAAVQPEFSFPSGHSMNSLVLYGALAVIVWALRGRRAGSIAAAIAGILVLLIGTSRIYLGYHYLSDVAGGFLAGAVWLAIAYAGFMNRRVVVPGQAAGPDAPSSTRPIQPMRPS
ncbi:MAG: phosphatase PAP2 family protein [Chloroflexi bacterium]|nr:phosphatase PAP2 family protein [Chloroflexota bacterium]